MIFNEEWVKTKTKAQFIKAFKDVYPKLDLGAEFDRIVPQKKIKVEEQPKEDVSLHE